MWILELHNPAANYNNYRGGGGYYGQCVGWLVGRLQGSMQIQQLPRIASESLAERILALILCI